MQEHILPADISFERWVTYIFDHPVPNPTPKQKDYQRQENERQNELYKQYQNGEITMQELGAARDGGEYTFPYPWLAWYWQNDADYWNPGADPARTVRYITRLFEHIVECTAPYSDAQINQGIEYIMNNSLSDHAFVLISPDVPFAAREACAYAICDVYEQLYNVRCTPHLSTQQHGDQADKDINPLNSSCYMWWDVFPFHGRATQNTEYWEKFERESLAKYFHLAGDALEAEFAKRRAAHLAESQRREELDNAFLVVMERTLMLSNPACQEGALHGLGHWHRAYPQRVEAAIDFYLAHRPDLQPALRAYAEQARVGYVL